MIRGVDTKRVLESVGPQRFVQLTREALGLTRDKTGKPCIQDQQISPREFSLRDLAESIIGENWAELVGPVSGGHMDHIRLQEDASAAVVPGSGINVSTWSATVAGLVEAKILEAYRDPVYIADELVETMPTRLRQDNLIGRADMGDDAETMSPASPHPRAQFEERYVQTPATQKRGLAVDVTREAVFFDLTNQVLQRADRVGNRLALNKEKRVFDVILGINNVYNYRGSSYNTYVSGGGNWINTEAGNLVDWTDIDEVLLLFSNMTDQETGERIAVTPTTLLVMPGRLMTARRVINATEIHVGDTTSATGTQTIAANPVAGMFDIKSSVHAYQRLTDADGGNVAAANALEYWYLGDFKRAFAYMENWAMQTRRSSPEDYFSIDHDLVMSVFSNEMGAAAVQEPRNVCQRTNG